MKIRFDESTEKICEIIRINGCLNIFFFFLGLFVILFFYS